MTDMEGGSIASRGIFGILNEIFIPGCPVIVKNTRSANSSNGSSPGGDQSDRGGDQGDREGRPYHTAMPVLFVKSIVGAALTVALIILASCMHQVEHQCLFVIVEASFPILHHLITEIEHSGDNLQARLITLILLAEEFKELCWSLVGDIYP
jgi:hypothetical protein